MTAKTPHILIVDDDEEHIFLLSEYLKKLGQFEISGSRSAAEAIELIRANLDRGIRVDLVLMDVLMPSVDGLRACRLIRSLPEMEEIPVIVVTANNAPDSLERAFEAGASDYIGKPVNRAELEARVRQVLLLREEIRRREERERELIEMTRQLEAKNIELQRLTAMDGLTGVANRRNFDENLDRFWRRCRRDRIPMSALMIDIDCFKLFNDTYGHQAGDDCLRTVACGLQQSLKRPDDFLARYGGEEFAVLLPGTGSDGAQVVASRLRVAVEELNVPFPNSPAGNRLTVSLGVSTMLPASGLTPFELIRTADMALYSAKRSGRNASAVYARQNEYSRA